MLPNVGRPDQIIRIIVGALLLALPLLVNLGTWGSLGAYAVGAVLIGTAALNFCPIYAVLGLSTHPKKRA